MAEEFDLEHASTGNMFRQAVSEDSGLGEKVRSWLDAGKLVPDELTARVVGELVLERWQSFILDGFPRTIPQAEMLDGMLREREQSLDAVLYFDLEEETAIERLTGRLVCKECGENYHRLFMPARRCGVCDRCGGELSVRTDSSKEVVRDRLAEYDEKTRPLVPYYERRGLLRRVDASQGPDAVSRETRALLTGLTARQQT